MSARPADPWIAQDDRPVVELPAWVREAVADAAPRLVLSEQGLALTGWGRGTAARWDQVLGVALTPSEQAPERACVLLPRGRGRAPWIEVPRAALPEGMTLQRLAEQVRARTGERGYRHAHADRPALPRDEMHARILARSLVPGALEIPITAGPGPRLAHRLLLATFGGLLGGYVGAIGGMVLAALLAAITGGEPSAAVWFLVTGAAGLAGAAFGYGFRMPRGKNPPRVLALTPGGCVCGFPTGVRAFAWDEVDRFALEPVLDGPGERTLTVVGRDGSVAGRIDTRWLDAPAETVVAVANEYRRRHRPVS